MGANSRGRNLGVAEHGRIYPGAAAISGRDRCWRVASHPARVSAWSGAAVRLYDSMGDRLTFAISTRWSSGIDQRDLHNSFQ